MRIEFEKLWDRLSEKLTVEEVVSSDGVTPNFLIRIPNGAVRVRVGESGSDVKDESYADVRAVSRHFVRKPIYAISAKVGLPCDERHFCVKTTADHTCMRITDWEGVGGNFAYERVSAKDLKVGDKVCVCIPEVWFGVEQCDVAATVSGIGVDENKDGSWVYDLEVATDKHVYFANDVLVHNSQFINLAPVTQFRCREAGLPEDTIFSKLTEPVRKKVIDDAYHILDLANENAKNLINANCHTAHGDVIHYSLEYVAAEGMYFAKKMYAVHKIISDDRPCNSFKYAGISVKKAEIPVAMKDFLKEIFESTMTQEWTEADYRKTVERAYNKFITLDWEDIAYYKKYRTVKRTLSLTESERGAQVHARAANFYNELISKRHMNLAGKYTPIGAGDEFRYSWILPTNEYGMNCIAFKDVFPEEFRPIFKPDYETMFHKIFTDSLKRYIAIMGYKRMDPTRQEEAPEFSIF